MDAWHRSECLEDTRISWLELIQLWTSDPSSNERRIFWLHGLAGSGKSTLATTLANIFREFGHLGAFIFCDRDILDRNDPSSIIRTLAYQLCQFRADIALAVLSALRETPTICASPIELQFQKLIVEPLASILTLGTSAPILLVIDALDECGDAKSRKSLMRVFTDRFTDLPVAIKCLITSRPEYDIQYSFLSRPHIIARELEIMSSANGDDLSLFLRRSLLDIRSHNVYLPLAPDWPGDETLSNLTFSASGLFIWASTAIAFIEDGHDPSERLQLVLSAEASLESESALDALYITALKTSGKWNDPTFCRDFQVILGAIMAAVNPLTSDALDKLLVLKRPSMHTISRFGCVLHWNENGPVRTLHPSFADFLSNKQRCGDNVWHVDLASEDRRLAEVCLEHLDKVLKRNILDLTTSSDDFDEFLPEETTYACCFWVEHLCAVEDDTRILAAQLDGFLHKHVLHWLECMSILERSRPAIALLTRLRKWATVSLSFV